MHPAVFTPFDTIESAQDFIRVLNETIVEARQEVHSDLQREFQSPPSRHRDALQITLYNLERLEKHMANSRRILNDLRSLRRLLFAERQVHRVKALSPQPTVKLDPVPPVIALIPAPKPIGIPVTSATVSSRRAVSA